MTKDDGDVLAATGEFIGAHVDMRIRRTSFFPPQILESLDRLVETHGKVAAHSRIQATMTV